MSTPIEVVEAFYRAIASKDAQALADLVERSFAADASIEFPAGLPYGGRVSGAPRIAKMFTQMATSPVPVGPQKVTVTDATTDSGNVVMARVTFDWLAPGTDQSIASSAVEVWRFADDRVAEMAAYYWDTAECKALIERASTQAR